jgi:hypothetical protein
MAWPKTADGKDYVRAVELSKVLTEGKTLDHVTGLQPDFADRLTALISSAPANIKNDLGVFSGFRSPERQAQLFNAAVKKYGSASAARKWVAPPGKSFHGKGQAVDLSYKGLSLARAPNNVVSWIHDNAPKYGLHFPLGNENWHIEPIGTRPGTAAHTDAVKKLQQTLVDRGAKITVDGVWGDETAKAFEQYSPKRDVYSAASFEREPRARALASGAGYDGLRNPVEIPTANDFRAPAPGLSTPRVTPAPTFTQGDRVVTNAPNMVGGGVNSMLGAIGNFASSVYNKAKDATPTPPASVGGSPLERLRATVTGPSMATRGGINNPQAAPVGAVQSSPLPAPVSNPSAPGAAALSKLRSMAEPQGDMRAAPGRSPAGTYAIGGDSFSREMQAQFDRNPLRVTGGQPASQPAKKAATPRETVRALGRATAEPGFMTSDMARRTPVSVPSSPVAQPAKTAAVSQPAFRSLGPATPPKSAPPSPTRQAAPGLARAVTAPASVASGTGGVLGMIGSGIAGGFNKTLAGLSAPSVKTQQAVQAEQAKAATKPAYSAQTARAARPPGNFSQPPRQGLSSLGGTLSGLSKLPAADPNKINQAAVTNALTGTLSGALTGGIPGAIAGGLWGYATTPAMANQMNSPTLADPNAFGLGSLGSMFSGGGSGRDSTGASFSRGTYSDGPGRGLSYGASASRSGTRSGPTAGRQAGGSK